MSRSCFDWYVGSHRKVWGNKRCQYQTFYSWCKYLHGPSYEHLGIFLSNNWILETWILVSNWVMGNTCFDKSNEQRNDEKIVDQREKCLITYLLKISKYQKQISRFHLRQKNEWKYFCIPALAYKKRSSEKSVRESK